MLFQEGVKGHPADPHHLEHKRIHRIVITGKSKSLFFKFDGNALADKILDDGLQVP